MTPFLELGHYAVDIFKTLECLEPKGCKAIKLMELRRGEAFGPFNEKNIIPEVDKEFYQQYLKSKDDKDELVKLMHDFGNTAAPTSSDLLPVQIVHLRQIYVMAQMMMAPNRTLRTQGWGNRAKLIFQRIGGKGKATEQEKLEDKEIEIAAKVADDYAAGTVLAMKHERDLIEKAMNCGKAPESFNVVMEMCPGVSGFRAIEIEPFRVRIHDYDDLNIREEGIHITKPHPSTYRATGTFVEEPDIRFKLIEGAVSTKGSNSLVNENGVEFKPEDLKKENNQTRRDEVFYKQGYYSFWNVPERYFPRGQTETYRNIINSRKILAGLPLDTSAEVQLMQTSPLETRVPNTMAVFGRHSTTLLADPKFGKQFERLFTLNLFRYGHLYQYIKSKPEYAVTFESHLNKILRTLEISNHVQPVLFIQNVYKTYEGILAALSKEIKEPENKKWIDQALEEVSKKCDSYHQELIANVEKIEQDDLLKPHRRALHQAVIMDYARKILPKLTDFEYDFLNDPENHFTLTDLKRILKCYFVVKQIPGNPDDLQLDQEKDMAYLFYRLLPTIHKQLKDQKTKNEWLNLLLDDKNYKADRSWSTIKPKQGCFDRCRKNKNEPSPVYRSENLVLDIGKGMLFVDNIAETPLPDHITANVRCQEIFGKDHIYALKTRHWQVEYKNRMGELYEIDYQGNTFRIIDVQGKAPFIFKKLGVKGQKKVWYQLLNLSLIKTDSPLKSFLQMFSVLEEKVLSLQNAETKEVPKALEEQFCWVRKDCKHLIFENKRGGLEYTAEVHPKINKHFFSSLKGQTTCKVKRLDKIKDKTFIQILNPWRQEESKLFKVMDLPTYISSSGEKDKVTHIRYERLNLEYEWNGRKKRWDCSNYPDQEYYLSEKTLNSIMYPSNTPEKVLENLPSLFLEEFQYYHLLESPTQSYRLLLSREKYQNAPPEKKVAKHLRRHEQPVIEPVRGEQEVIPPMFYTFEVDPVKGLRSEDPEAYLYLAYVLYAQKKYSQASFYLNRARDIKVTHSSDCKTILKWMYDWIDPSEDALAVKSSLAAIEFEQTLILSKNTQLSEDQLKRLAEVVIQLFLIFKKSPDVVPPFLEEMKNEIQVLLGNFVSLIDSVVKNVKDDIDIEALRDKIIPMLASFEMQKELINLSLEAEIQYMKEKVENIKKKEVPPAPEPVEELIFDEDLRKYLTPINEPSKEETELWEKRKQRLREEFHIGEDKPGYEYVQELGQELLDDLEKALEKKGLIQKDQKNTSLVQLKSDASLANLEKLFAEKNQKSTDQVLMAKAAVIAKIKRPSQDGGWKELNKIIREQNEALEKQFEECLYCFAANDPERLVQRGWIKENDLEEVEKNIESFLVKSIQQQQLQQGLELVHALKNESDDDIKRQQLANHLNLTRHYDYKTDPYRNALMLMEYDSKKMVWKTQIDNIRDMLSGPNRFKHEALAGGKTTILRVIISKLKADGAALSGVITHEPLIEMHHPLLEKSTRQAYGETAYRFSFDRGDPTDVNALKLILRNLYKMITEKGRLDCTKKDLLSLHHAFIIKYEHLLDPSYENKQNELHDEIDLLNDILDILLQRAKIGNDELDKVCDSEKEHNYALDSRTKEQRSEKQSQTLNPVKCKAALEIMEWILSDEKYKKIFQSNRHSKMEQHEIDEFLVTMAKKVHEKYMHDLDENLSIQYLTQLTAEKVPYEEINRFYEDHVDKHADRDKIAAFYRFFRHVLPSTFNNTGGVQYGRSKNGIMIKPYEVNGKPSENSERGTEEETIWYTCLDYMDQTLGGVHPEQIAQMVLQEQIKGSALVLDELEIDPSYKLNLEDTPQGRDFKERYNMDLSKVTPGDYKKIADQINGDIKQLKDFILYRVFFQYSLTKEKVTGNAQDLVGMVDEFFGSSGTSNSFRALPDKIDTSERDLVKQPGVDGDYLMRLLQDYQEGDIIEYDDRGDVAKEIAGKLNLNPGSALIDLAPAFPGLTASRIVENIADNMSQDTQFRYVHHDDALYLYENGERKLAPSSLNPENLVTILDQAHTRGTDLRMGAKSIGYVTIGPKTKFSDFLQAVMRMRKLGNGQKVRFLIDSKTKALLGDHPTLENLIELLNRNEANALKKLHYKAAKQKIQAMGKVTLFKQLHKIKDRRLRKLVWPICRRFFIQPTQEQLQDAGKPAKEMNAVEALREFAQEQKKLLEETIKELKSSGGVHPMYEALQKVIKNPEAKTDLDRKIANPFDGKYLPATVAKMRFELDTEVCVEQEQMQEQEQLIQLKKGEKKVDWTSMKELTVENRRQLLEKLDTVRVNDSQGSRFTEEFDWLKREVYFCDRSIFLTMNIATDSYMSPSQDYWDKRWQLLYGRSKLTAEEKAEQLAGENIAMNDRRVMRFMILVDRKNNNKVYSVVGAPKDYDLFLEKLDKPACEDPEIDVYFYNIQNEVLDGRNGVWKDYPAEVQKEIVKHIVQVKFIAGEVKLLNPPANAPMLKQQYQVFLDWMKNQNFVLAENSLKTYLQEMRPTLLTDYKESPMAKAFTELKPKIKT